MSRATLGIDTASRQGSVALALDGASVASAPIPPGGHSSGLSAAAETLLAAGGLGIRDLAGVSVAGGPGSFTGLRVGLAWAKGIAAACSIPLALVPSHEAMARWARRRAAAIATVLPGERGHVQVAFWEGGDEVRLLFGPVSVPEAAAASVLAERSEGRPGERPGVLLAGLPEAPAAALREAGFRLLAGGPVAEAVAELGDRMIREGRAADPVTAAPSYGRAPNARKPAR